MVKYDAGLSYSQGYHFQEIWRVETQDAIDSTDKNIATEARSKVKADVNVEHVSR